MHQFHLNFKFLRKLPNSGEKGDLLKRSKPTVWPMAQFRKRDVSCHYLSYPKYLASCVHWGREEILGCRVGPFDVN